MRQTESFKFLDAYAPIFTSDKRYFVISGGRASGKSTNIAAYFVLLLLQDDYFRGVISRYTQRSLTHSIYKDILDIIDQWGVKHLLSFTGDEIKNKQNGNSIITHSFRIGDLSQTAKGKGLANPTHLLIDEATELPSEVEYIKTIDSFRTKGSKTQIFILFNPTTKHHWLYKRFFASEGVPKQKWLVDHYFLHTTYQDNLQNLDLQKVAEWERSRTEDPEYFDHHILGHWSSGAAGKVFRGWIVEKIAPDAEAEVTYGIDFGFSNDPSTCVQVSKYKNRLWLREIVYQTGLTTADLFEELNRKGVPLNATLICDSADPRSIEELKRLGYRNARACYKGPDSIRSGINKIKSFEVHVDIDSTNLLYEYDMYSWKVGTEVPVDSYNHLLDATRYALSVEKASGQYVVRGSYSASRDRYDEER
jgi:phage terminase large subunit